MQLRECLYQIYACLCTCSVDSHAYLCVHRPNTPHYIGGNTTILVLTWKVQLCLCLGVLVNLQRESEWVEEGFCICLCECVCVCTVCAGCCVWFFRLRRGASPLFPGPVVKLIRLNVCGTECPLSPEESSQCSLTDSSSFSVSSPSSSLVLSGLPGDKNKDRGNCGYAWVNIGVVTFPVPLRLSYELNRDKVD